MTHKEGQWGLNIYPTNWQLDWWRGSGYRFLQVGCLRFWIKWSY